MMRSKVKGFSLIELMIVVAIMAIIAAVAMPAYTGYIRSGRVGALINNIATIEVFQEDFRLRTGAYQAGVFNGGGPNAGLLLLGWRPQSNDGTVYTITVAGATYDVVAVDTSGVTVCRRFPAKVAC